jgi:hypothetical protein
MKAEVTAEKQHPALWQRVGAHWEMKLEYQELWWQFQKGRISRATFFRKKSALKAAWNEQEAS